MIKKYPWYLKITVILLGLILFSFILSELRDILVPLSFALFLAILLNPLVALLEGWKIPKTWAIIFSLLTAILVIVAIGYFLSMQMSNFSDQLPLLKKKSADMVSRLQQLLTQKLNIPMAKQNQFIDQAQAGLKPLVGRALGSVVGSLAVIFLLPVYTFLFLYYKMLILDFLYDIFSEENMRDVAAVLKQVKTAIQSYMFGLLLEGLIVATLNTTALMLLGVKYAILLGVLGAVLNVLPFIGGILAVLPPLLIATMTKDGIHTQVGIIISYIVIQFVDNHFLVPYIVSSKVKINALISIVIVLLGGAVWGVSGMFLAIPFIGVLKIIFDRVPELKPWGRLLGDEVPVFHKGQLRLKRQIQRILPKGKGAKMVHKTKAS
jgi:predicted PurR-regulated permease PerM